MQEDDYTDELLSFESDLKYNKLQNGVRIKKESDPEARDRQKKDNHNMSKLGTNINLKKLPWAKITHKHTIGFYWIYPRKFFFIQ